MEALTLEQAKKILAKHTTEAHLFTHAAAVSAAMGAMADHFGADKEHWEAVGYLHDVDYEKYPDEHCLHVRELLEPEGVPEEDIRAIISHGYGITTEEAKPETDMEKSLAAKCSREIIKQGFAMLGMEAGEVMQCCIDGMQAHKEELGF